MFAIKSKGSRLHLAVFLLLLPLNFLFVALYNTRDVFLRDTKIKGKKKATDVYEPCIKSIETTKLPTVAAESES